MKRFIKWLSITLGILIIIIVLVGGYFGLVPGVSSIFGFDKPKDLGITYTEADRLSGRAKAGWEVIELQPDLPPEESYNFTGQNAVDTTFNERELTAWANEPRTNFPLSDCQIRVNEITQSSSPASWTSACYRTGLTLWRWLMSIPSLLMTT